MKFVRYAGYGLLLISQATVFYCCWGLAPPDQDPGVDRHAASSSPTYVGKAVCKECHQANFDFHSRHGHASTFSVMEQSSLSSQYAGKEHDAGKVVGKFKYHGEANGKLSVSLPDKFGEKRFPLQYVLGSGKHAQTIITLISNLKNETECVEHRVSFFPDRGLGLTPGQTDTMTTTNSLELFGQFVLGDKIERCVYCHTTTASIKDEQVVNLRSNVNCEKCHGPGSEHVASARKNPKPVPYSVGMPTWDAESEIQLCGDCHRLPWHVTEKEVREYPDVLVRFQPIGLLRSSCYLKSEGEMKCTTCHNPHEPSAEVSLSRHIKNCIACHQEQNDQHVACPVSTTEGCIDCHMPAVSIGFGLSFHDHWIRIRKNQ